MSSLENSQPENKISLLALPVPIYARLTFLLLGVSSLMSMNAIIIGLDFFSEKFQGFEFPFYFQIPMFLGMNIQNFLMHKLSKYVSLNKMIIAGLLGQAVLGILLTLEANYLDNRQGFDLAMLIIFFVGVFISMMYSSAVAFATLINSKCINEFFTGTAIGGCLICFIRLIVLKIVGTDTSYELLMGTLIYVAAATIILLITIANYQVFFHSAFCKLVVSKSVRKTFNYVDNNNIIEKNLLLNGLKTEKIVDINKNCIEEENISKNTPINDGDSKKEQKITNKNHIMNVFKKIMPMPSLICLIYVQTCMVFPGLALEKKITGLNPAWGSTLLVLAYNIGDAIGKYLCSFRKFYNKNSTIVLIMGRFLFYVSFIVILTVPDGGAINTNWFAFTNAALFGLTNGYATSSIMVLASEEVENKEEKENTGFIMSIGLGLGTVCGAFLSLTIKNIGK